MSGLEEVAPEPAVEEPAPEPAVEEPAPEPTVEALARQVGWRAPEELRNPPANPKSASEWLLERGNVVEDLKHKLDKQNDKLDEAIHNTEQAKLHFERLEKTRTDRVRAEFETRRREAIEASDYDEVKQIERERDETLAEQGPAPSADNEVDAWKKENPWYSKNAELTDMVDMMADGLMARDVPVQEALKTISDRMAPYVKELNTPPENEVEEPPMDNPDTPPRDEQGRFQAQPPAVEAGSPAAASPAPGQPYTAQHLTAEERRYGEAFIRSGAIESLDEYAAQLAEMEGLA